MIKNPFRFVTKMWRAHVVLETWVKCCVYRIQMQIVVPTQTNARAFWIGVISGWRCKRRSRRRRRWREGGKRGQAEAAAELGQDYLLPKVGAALQPCCTGLGCVISTGNHN
jgi:hypothetical protein